MRGSASPMIFTPEERRAGLALLALVALGQLLACYEARRRERPDRELSEWLNRLAAAHSDSTPGASDTLSSARAAAALSEPPRRTPEAEGEKSRTAEVRGRASTEPRAARTKVRSRAEAPPGILEGGRLRINEADAAALEALPGVGPSLAARILAARERRPFRRAEDLLDVSGIGEKKLAQLRPWLDFGASRKGIAPDSAAARLGR